MFNQLRNNLEAYLKIALITLVISCLHLPTTAQVVSDGNFIFNAGGDTISNFTVPAGNNRVLIVGIHGASKQITGFSYNGLELKEGVSTENSFPAEIWYLALGSGSSIGPSDIVVTSNPIMQEFTVLSAHSLHGVDQTTVIANKMSHTITGDTSTMSTLSFLTSNTDNLILDVLNNIKSIPTAQAPHSALGTEVGYAGGVSKTINGIVNLTWTFDQDNVSHSAIELLAAQTPSIPSLSQWGIILVSLLLLSIGSIFLRQNEAFIINE